ncbi:UPF0759 protein yecE [Escherichia coli KTE132]|nr:UPF0759 protein yecE [Escherichia coli KTE132]
MIWQPEFTDKTLSRKPGAVQIRFIGSDDMTQNRELFQVWLQKLAQWHQTTTPYLFLHTPDIAQAPELVHTLWEDLRKTLPEIGAVPAIPQQSSLF